MVKPRGESSQLGRNQHRALGSCDLLGFPAQGQRGPGSAGRALALLLGMEIAVVSSQGNRLPWGLCSLCLPFLSSKCAFLIPQHSGHAGVHLWLLRQKCCCHFKAPASQEGDTIYMTSGLRNPNGILSANLPPAGTEALLKINATIFKRAWGSRCMISLDSLENPILKLLWR